MFDFLIHDPFVNILVALILLIPGHSAGWAIIVFTILIRLVLLVPNRHALESQKKIQALQPEIDQIKTDFKDDQQAQAQALMELYKKNDISMFGSCLPLLIQLPILIILYRILQTGFTPDALTALYSFVPQPEYINTNFFGIDLAKPDPTLIMPVLAGGFQFIQTIATLASGRKRGQKVPGQGIFLIFPVMTFLIAKQINAGAALYWIVTTLFGIGQQIIVNRNRVKLVHADQLDIKPHKQKKSDTPAPEKKSVKKGVDITVRPPK